MNKFVTFTSTKSDAKMSFSIDNITLVIDNASENNGVPTLIMVNGYNEAFGVKEDYTKVMRAIGV
jgi:hypothetical protein